MLKKIFRKKIVKDALILSISHFVIQISGLCSSLLVFRYLGPANVGLTTFLQNYLTIFVTFFSGVDLYANWHTVTSDVWNKKVSSYVKFKFVLVVVASLCFLFIAKFLFPKDIFILSLVSLLPIFTSIFGSYVFLIQFQNKIKLQAFAATASSLFLLSLRLLAVYFKMPVVYFIFITSLDGVFLAIIAYLSLRKSLEYVPWYLSLQEGVVILRKSLFSILYVYSWFFIIKIDQLLLPVFFSIEKLGLYSSAVRVTELANVLVVLMQSLLLPRVVSLHEGDKATKNTFLALSFYTVVSFFLACLLSFFSQTWISLLFGERFKDSSPILAVYAWTLPGIFITNFFSVIAFSKKKYFILAISGVCLFLVAAPLTYLAALSGNIQLVASVSVLIYSISAWMLFVLWKRKML